MFIHKPFKNKTLIIIFTLIFILMFTACGSEKNNADASDSSEAPASSEANNAADDKLTVISFDDFKNAASVYGDLHDMSDSFGYPAAAVTGENINIIYMTPKTEADAKSMILEENSSETQNIKVVSSGSNFEYYEETAEAKEDESIEAFYGYYLRADNMAILITGPLDKKDTVKQEAVNFYNKLGYTNA
ncbi:MAG: hypothetical protein HFE90_00470 [Firmicutes bacterium]|nr:hypothetical protein [Bacillota bacterium]